MSSSELKEIVKLLEEQNEVLKEQNVLHGEILSALDELKNVFLSTKVESQVVKNDSIKEIRENPCVDDIDPLSLAKALDGLTSAEISVFWPKVKAPPNWVRVSIEYEDLESLQARIKKGCMCGGQIILKKTPTAEFFTCSGVTKNKCSYRPAVYTSPTPRFITNLAAKIK